MKLSKKAKQIRKHSDIIKKAMVDAILETDDMWNGEKLIYTRKKILNSERFNKLFYKFMEEIK